MTADPDPTATPARAPFGETAADRLRALGVELSDTHLQIMSAVEQLYRPHLRRLLDADLGDALPQRCTDLTRAPGGHDADLMSPEARSTSAQAGGTSAQASAAASPDEPAEPPAGTADRSRPTSGADTDGFCELGLCEQAAAIADGSISAEQALDAVLRRIGERNPALNAIVETFPQRSREMLDAAPAGPLRGVPIAIKDEWPLPWRAERLGAAGWIASTEPGESGPYRALRAAGAVIAGVANMHELGAGTTGAVSAFGPTRNPWDRERCPGGSSAGSGSAVAARLVASAVGADGAGSIRIPASWCGVTGLKPTFGRSAMTGHHLDRRTETIVSGPICRDSADCRLLAAALIGEPLEAGDVGGLRIGIPPGPAWEDCAPAVRAACETAVGELRRETGGELREISIDGLEHVLVASLLLMQAEELSLLTPERVNALPEELSVVARAVARYRMLVPALALERAALARSVVRESLARAFERVDVIAWPTLPATAPPLDNPVVELPSGPQGADMANPRFAAIANLTGAPAISVPVGLCEQGMPIGLQLLGPWGADSRLLDAAEALERATERAHVDAAPPSSSPPSP